MSSEPGSPRKGESASTDVVPQSRPVEASALDDGWGDAPVDPEPVVMQAKPETDAKPSPSILPQSLSPVTLSSADRRSSAPPPASDQPAETASAKTKSVEAAPHKPKTKDARPEPKDEPKHAAHVAHPGRRLRKRLRSGYVLLPVSALAAGIALIILRPKEIAPDKPIAAQAPVAAAQVPGPIANQPLAQPTQAMEQAAPAATAEPVDSAMPPPVASASATPSASATSGDSFVDAFQKNAAKSNTKWAEVKRESGKPEINGAAKPPPTKPASAQPAAPGQADPLDVLKRLEAARKGKK